MTEPQKTAKSAEKIRVLVVDDSAFMRKMISKLVNGDPGLTVVGTARDGMEAIRKLGELKPQVVTLDLEMPRLDGLQTLGYIMSENPTPCVMLSAHTPRGAQETLKALEYGAVDFIQKPSGSISLDLERVAEELVTKIKVAHGINLKKLPFLEGEAGGPSRAAEGGVLPVRTDAEGGGVLLVGASTGGPRALSAFLPRLPKDLPVPVLVVQHMSAGFTRSLAERLDHASQIRVREAAEGQKIAPGMAYLAPGDWHMEVFEEGGEGVLRLNQRPPVLGVRPSVDLLFLSAARAFGRRCLAVVLTGMGHDGTKGARAVKKAGGAVLAQDEASCVVFGMPRAVMEAGCADRMVPLDGMAGAVVEALDGVRGGPGRQGF